MTRCYCQLTFNRRPWRLVSEILTTAIEIETMRQPNRLQGVSAEDPRAWFPKNSKVPTRLKPCVNQMACMVEALLTSPIAAFRMHFSISFAKFQEHLLQPVPVVLHQLEPSLPGPFWKARGLWARRVEPQERFELRVKLPLSCAVTYDLCALIFPVAIIRITIQGVFIDNLWHGFPFIVERPLRRIEVVIILWNS
jgi:hypothetical protein